MLARRRFVLLLVFALTVFGRAAAQVTINVDAALNRHAIDPRIYGVAWAPDAATVTDLGVTINRWGGNAMSRYNWAFSTANRCKDWYFENIADTVSSGDGSNGKSADDFISMTIPNGAQPIITIPMMGLLPKNRPASPQCGYSVLKYGAQDFVDPWNNDCGNGKQGDVRMLGVNDPADTSAAYTSAHQGNWIQHLVATWGNAASGGVRYYALDNEPVLWSFDHWDIHPTGSTYDEIWSKMADYGAVIKANDPTSLTTGLEEWGWSGYFDSGLDAENYPSTADRDAHGGVYLAEWLLQQARAYEQTNGVRIVDFATLHFYPQSGEFGCCNELDPTVKAIRNRSTRSLWDPNYVDESWIGGTGIDGGIVRLIPRLRQWTANDYPGTKIGITEYNWGAENDANGATAQADILGIFGREGLDLGVRWTSPPAGSNVYEAFKMYRNYDGSHSRFGDISVGAGGPNPDSVATFAALRSTDRALTVMVINKDLTNPAAVTVNVANYVPAGAAQVWQLDAGNAITRMPDIAAAPFSLTVPATSVTLLVIPGSYLDSPTGLVATASTATTVNLIWNAVPGATSYGVYRRTSLGAAPVLVGSPTNASFSDSGLAANTTYLYQVQAVSASFSSGLSAIDPATTVLFTDDPLVVATPIKSVHIAELRTAVNAVRVAAGLPVAVFTDDPLVPGTTVVKAVHLRELRSALEQARAVLGIAVPTYADTAITPATTPVRSGQITEIRNGVK